MVHLRTHINIALGYFILAATLGVLLRAFVVVDIPINYKFIVHTHSHIALLGWAYVALTILLYKLYIQTPLSDKKYRKIFWFTQLTLVGMLVTFPFQGYALFSIVFSTLFLFSSYWFFWFFRKRVKRKFKKSNSLKCIKAALWYLLLSSVGPWALGAIMNTLGAESVWYRLAIYFYLHFQYNGWMIMVLLGIFFYILEQHQIALPVKRFKMFFLSINLGILLTFSLSTLWTNPPIALYVLGGLGALLQLLALSELIRFSVFSKSDLKPVLSRFQLHLLITVTVLLAIKMMLQLITTIPYFANLAATVLDFTIGYLHWTFLGVVTIALFLFMDYFKLIRLPKMAYFLYVIGFIGTEALIFYKGIAVWLQWRLFDTYFELLALVSLLILISLLFILTTKRRS